jgi:hypothetical protein
MRKSMIGCFTFFCIVGIVAVPDIRGHNSRELVLKEAEPRLREAVEGRRLKLGDTHPHTIESWNKLIDLYEAWDKPKKAQEWQAKLAQIEATTE